MIIRYHLSVSLNIEKECFEETLSFYSSYEFLRFLRSLYSFKEFCKIYSSFRNALIWKKSCLYPQSLSSKSDLVIDEDIAVGVKGINERVNVKWQKSSAAGLMNRALWWYLTSYIENGSRGQKILHWYPWAPQIVILDFYT